MMRTAVLSMLPLLLVLAGGCGEVVRPAARVVDPVPVYIADYGVHSSLLLPINEHRYVEYAFGDWGYAAMNRCGPQDALGALLASGESAFGRRFADVLPGDLDPTPPPPHPKRLIRIYASRGPVQKLESRLADRFDRAIDTVVHNPENDTDYVRDTARYGVANNCNHLTADSLRELGCEVSGVVVLSKFKVKPVEVQVEPPPVAAAPAPSEGAPTMPTADAK